MVLIINFSLVLSYYKNENLNSRGRGSDLSFYMKRDSVLFMQKATSTERLVPRVHFAALALISFILSVLVARAFTHFYPGAVLISGDLHIHHFWFGIALLAIGGWRARHGVVTTCCLDQEKFEF